jgi:anti-anti-sigma factor
MTLSIVSVQSDSYHVITLDGELDTKTAPSFFDVLKQLDLAAIPELRIEMEALIFLSSAGLRALVFAKQKMPHESRLILIGASDSIVDVIVKTGLTQAVTLVSSHSAIDDF